MSREKIAEELRLRFPKATAGGISGTISKLTSSPSETKEVQNPNSQLALESGDEEVDSSQQKGEEEQKGVQKPEKKPILKRPAELTTARLLCQLLEEEQTLKEKIRAVRMKIDSTLEELKESIASGRTEAL